MQTEATVGLPWQNSIALHCLERHVIGWCTDALSR